MKPKEKYEARRAARKVEDEARARNASHVDADPEELLYDLANSLERIAVALESRVSAKVTA